MTKPVVLADISDNPLSCGSGDTTELLRELVKMNIPDTLFGGLYDPKSIEALPARREPEIRYCCPLEGKYRQNLGSPYRSKQRSVALSERYFSQFWAFQSAFKSRFKGGCSHSRWQDGYPPHWKADVCE